MSRQKICSQCGQSNTCQHIYEKLGNIKGPSVVLKVIAAFLLPIVMFIGTLVAFEKILSGKIASKQLQTVLSFLLALTAAFIFVVIIKVINKRFGKKWPDRQ